MVTFVGHEHDWAHNRGFVDISRVTGRPANWYCSICFCERAEKPTLTDMDPDPATFPFAIKPKRDQSLLEAAQEIE